jgi:hypothetical protein
MNVKSIHREAPRSQRKSDASGLKAEVIFSRKDAKMQRRAAPLKTQKQPQGRSER